MSTRHMFVLLLVTASFASPAYAEESFWSWLISPYRKIEVAGIDDAIYKKECGACHFAYQPGLLPERSWRKLLEGDALSNHFKENAELDEKTRDHVLSIMTANAADKSYYKRSRKIMSSLDDDMTPTRITEVPYMRDKHSAIDPKLIKDNPKVKSLSYCDNCHRQAHVNRFDDDTVLIPTVSAAAP